MKIKYILLFLIFLSLACSRNNSNPQKANLLAGNWGFLDKHGNYNEAYFTDTTYISYNRNYGLLPRFIYAVRNDSLFANVDPDKKDVLVPIVRIKWLGSDKVIFHSEFARDTLERIKENRMTLENTSLKKDSLSFRAAYENRFGEFLVKRGVITRHEADSMKKVREKMFKR